VNGCSGGLGNHIRIKSWTRTSKTSAISPKVFHSSSVNNNARRPGVLKTQSSMAYKRISDIMDGYGSFKTDFLEYLGLTNHCMCVVPTGTDIPDHSQSLTPVRVLRVLFEVF
jgi:hypothetical protein